MGKCEKYYGKSVFDYKLCGKNLLDNFKIQNNFYDSIFSGYGRLKNIIEDDNKLQKYIQGLWDNGEELCEFCKYNGECNGMTCNGNGPVYPACADLEFDSYIDWDKVCDIVIDDKIKNSIEKEEEKEMNKVLSLWFERKQEKIIKKYAEMEQDFINNHYSVVKSYNELVEQFEKDLDDLYKFDKVNEQFVLEEISDKNTIKYDIDFDKLSCEFTDKHIKEKQGELKELAKIREEVEAQLSLSNELKYQQDVLIQYNIIDKKTKKIVE